MRIASWLLLLFMLLPPAGIAATRLSETLLQLETSAEHLHYALDSVELTLDQVRIHTHLLSPDAVRVERLQARRMTLELKTGAGPSPTPVLPASLALPLPVTVEQADVEELILNSGGQRQVFKDVHFRFSGDARRLRLEHASAATPWGELTLDLDLEAAMPHALSGQARLERTATAHPYSLQATLSGQLDRILARLDGRIDATTVSANAELTPFQPVPLASLQVHGDAINLQAWQPALPPSRYALEISASGEAVADSWGLRGRLEAVDASQAILPRRLTADFQWRDDFLRVPSLVAELAGSASFTARGELHLAGEQALDWQGELQGLDPSAFGAYPQGQVQAHWSWRGKLQPDLQTNFSLQLHDSQLGGQPLIGEAGATTAGGRLPHIDALFKLGGSRLSLQGAYGASGDKLSWQAELDDLRHFPGAMSGKLSASGAWLSHPDMPGLEFRLQGDALALPGGHRLDAIQAQGSLAPGLPGKLQADTRLDGYRGPVMELRDLRLELAGERGRHTLTLRGDDPAHQLQLALSGKLENGGWRGMLERLRHEGNFSLALREPSTVEIGRERVTLGKMALQIDSGTLDINSLEVGGGRLNSAGQARNLPFSLLWPWLGGAFSGESTLALSADWDIRATSALDGHIRLWRESGDLVLGNPGQAWQLDTLQARAVFDQGRMDAMLELAGGAIGKVQLQAGTRIGTAASAIAIDPAAPFELKAAARLDSLAWLAHLPGMAGTLPDGSLQLDLQGSGSLNHPNLMGTIEADKLRLEMPEYGIDLQQGTLSARIEGQKLLLRQLRWQGKTGSLELGGEIGLANLHPEADIALEARDFTLLSRTDRQLVISGNGKLQASRQRLNLQGDFVFDKGFIELPSASAPRLGDDVYVIGRENAAPASPLPPMARIDLGIDLGKQFRLQGRGLDVQLAGAIRFSKVPDGNPRSVGSISVAEGTFLAYGQTLVIERGILNFSGPIENPGLDIRAMRKQQAVEAGVEIGGNALQPQIKLVSNPDVPDNEKLSWLLLGHGTDRADKSEFAMLSLAAGALLSQGNSVPLQTRFARAAGLDEVGVGTSTTKAKDSNEETEETVVTLGKRLSSDLYLNYQHGLYGLQDVVKITYDITQNWSIQGLTGSETAADLFYSFSFD